MVWVDSTAGVIEPDRRRQLMIEINVIPSHDCRCRPFLPCM